MSKAKPKLDPVPVPRATMERILGFVSQRLFIQVQDTDDQWEDMNDDEAIQLQGDIRQLLGMRRSAL